MRRIVVGVVIVAGLAVAASAALPAQMAVSSPVRFGVTGGLTAPVGSLSDNTDLGWNAGALVNVGFPLLPLGFRLDALWQQMPGSGTSALSTKARVIDGTLNATYSFGGLSPINFYFIGGLGVYNVHRETRYSYATPSVLPGGVSTSSSSNSQTRFGLNGGIGFLFRLSGFSMFAEARYHDVFTSGGSTQIVPVSVGIVF
jgi:opacity protein-like surface antigen